MGQGYINKGQPVIVYVNGDSYADMSDGLRYSDYLGNMLGCQSQNAAIPGSANSRIIRSSLRDLMQLQKTQSDIVAVVALTYTIRCELWDPTHTKEKWRKNNDGDFASCQFAHSRNWFFSKNNTDELPDEYVKYQSFGKEWLTWYDVEAELTNLLSQILMFTAWCRQNNIKYVILSSIPQEKVDFDAPFIDGFYRAVMADPMIVDIFDNSFTEWCGNHGHKGFDELTHVVNGKEVLTGHQREVAHRAYAEYLINNYIK